MPRNISISSGPSGTIFTKLAPDKKEVHVTSGEFVYELLRGTTSNNPDIVVITNLDKDTSENSIIEMTVTGADDNKDDCNHNIYEGSKIRTFDEFTKVLLSVRKTILTIQINKWGGSGSNPFGFSKKMMSKWKQSVKVTKH